MNKFKYLFMLGLGLTLVFNVTGCRRRPRADSAIDGISPIGAWDSDQIYGEGLGPRFGEDGQYIEGQFPPVLFAFDSAQIAPTERAKLDEVARYMRRHSNVNMIIEGHTDERGSREYNLSLGERRALATRAYLIGLGIDGARLQTRSFGQERPAAFGHNEEAWRQNRRSEFVITQ